jgi:hypothetical protein
MPKLKGIELAEEFARVIAARDDEILIAKKHKELVSIKWGEGLPKEPYAVHLANVFNEVKILVIDADDVEEDKKFEQLASRLRILPHVECISGPTSNRHFFLPLHEWTESDKIRSLVLTLDHQFHVDSSGPQRQEIMVIRPPFSPHSRGGRSKIIGDPYTALITLKEKSSDFQTIVQTLLVE